MGIGDIQYIYSRTLSLKHRNTHPLEIQDDQYATMSFVSRCKDSHNVSLLHFTGRPLFWQFGTKTINSCLGGNDTGPRTIFPRNCIVLMSIMVCTIGMPLNLLRISLTVILYFITCHRLILMIFLTLLLTNLSNFLDRSTRRAQLSHPQCNRLIGMATKIK